MARFLLLISFSLFYLQQLTLQQLTLAQSSTPLVPASTVADLLKKRSTVLLDVRTPAEFATGHLAGAENLDFRAPGFREQVAKLDKTKTYVLYCASGNRSGQTLTLMQAAGFQNVVNAGGFKELKAAGLKTAE